MNEMSPSSRETDTVVGGSITEQGESDTPDTPEMLWNIVATLVAWGDITVRVDDDRTLRFSVWSAKEDVGELGRQALEKLSGTAMSDGDHSIFRLVALGLLEPDEPFVLHPEGPAWHLNDKGFAAAAHWANNKPVMNMFPPAEREIVLITFLGAEMCGGRVVGPARTPSYRRRSKALKKR